MIGCFIPVLPGPPLNYLSLLILHFGTDKKFSETFLVTWALIAIGVTVLDYIIPVYGTKKLGGSNYGIWGSAIGIVVGIFLFPPIGIIVGPFLGAWIGEIISGKSGSLALRAAFGSLLGFIAGTLIKLIVSLVMTYYFVVQIFT